MRSNRTRVTITTEKTTNHDEKTIARVLAMVHRFLAIFCSLLLSASWYTLFTKHALDRWLKVPTNLGNFPKLIYHPSFAFNLFYYFLTSTTNDDFGGYPGGDQQAPPPAGFRPDLFSSAHPRNFPGSNAGCGGQSGNTGSTGPATGFWTGAATGGILGYMFGRRK